MHFSISALLLASLTLGLAVRSDKTQTDCDKDGKMLDSKSKLCRDFEREDCKKVSKAYDDEKKKCYACTGTKISTDGDDCEEPNTIRRSDCANKSPSQRFVCRKTTGTEPACQACVAPETSVNGDICLDSVEVKKADCHALGEDFVGETKEKKPHCKKCKSTRTYNQSTQKCEKITSNSCLADQQFVNGQCQQCPGTYDYNSLESAQAGQPCQQHKYCRFPGYDCDSINHNTFYGSFPDWLNVPGAKETSGNEILAGSGASDGESERYCLNTFPDSAHTDGSFSGFVFVPDNDVIYGGAAFQVYCKSGQTPSVLWKSNERTCNLLGSCQMYIDSGFIAYSEAFGGGASIYHEDVYYTNDPLPTAANPNPPQSCHLIDNPTGLCSNNLVIA